LIRTRCRWPALPRCSSAERDVDPEVLARLVAAGKAVAVKSSKPAESEESA
jgi:hypothetical protein